MKILVLFTALLILQPFGVFAKPVFCDHITVDKTELKADDILRIDFHRCEKSNINEMAIITPDGLEFDISRTTTPEEPDTVFSPRQFALVDSLILNTGRLQAVPFVHDGQLQKIFVRKGVYEICYGSDLHTDNPIVKVRSIKVSYRP